MRPAFVLALVIFTVVGCATPYQPMGFRGGYSESDLTSNQVEVNFRGNGYTPRETVRRYVLFRSAEVTLDRGFRFFRVLNSDSDSTFSAVTSVNQTANTATTQVIRKPVESVRILLLMENPDPQNPYIYDAADVQRTIGPSVPRK